MTESFELGWTGLERFNPTPFDEKARALLAVDPDAWLVPRLLLDAPADWMDAHPEQVTGYADPTSWQDQTSWFGPRHPSWASARWRQDAGAMLRRLIRHVARREYAARIIGWHLGSGIYGEWHWWNAVYYPDTSPAFVAAYRDWLARKYPGQTPAPRLPTMEERRRAAVGMFRDPARNRWLIDHAEFLHLVGAEALAGFARAVKEETAGRSLVVAFNGYLPDLGVNHEIDHRAFDVTLRNPDIDAFASPHTYWRRGPGQDGIFRGFPASVRAHGKLWIDEADDRTHLATPTQYKHVQTSAEAVEVLWRAFAQALTLNCGLWFMDQAGLWSENQETGWYQDPAILESFAQMQQIATESLNRSRQRICDLAVVYSFHTAFHLADRATELDQVTLPLVTRQLEQFARCGVPFDLHLLTELFEPATPEYQAYAFVDTFFLSDADLARIVSLREAGKLLLFFYAPGFAGEHGLSVDRLAGLLQMEVDQVDSIRLPDGKEQRPGFIVRGQDGPLVRRGNVWFCPAPPLPAANLRRALRTAGLHVWLDTNDVLYVGGGYLAIHAATDGPKRLQSPHATRWTNVRSGKQLAGSAAEVTVPLTRGQTLLLAIEPSGS